MAWLGFLEPGGRSNEVCPTDSGEENARGRKWNAMQWRNHRRRIDKYLATLLANLSARKVKPPAIDKISQCKMADCPSYY